MTGIVTPETSFIKYKDSGPCSNNNITIFQYKNAEFYFSLYLLCLLLKPSTAIFSGEPYFAKAPYSLVKILK
jgi:hypothetical protein